jgi:TatD DNase family protein
MLFDTHAHLNDERFDETRKELIESLAENAVGAYCEIGYDIASSKAALELAGKYDFIYAACGVHPHDTQNLTEEDMTGLKELLQNPKAVALGEIGLDYYYKPFDRDVQIKAFERQIEYAISVNLPIIVHTRDATKDTVDIIKSYSKSLNGKFLMHCYAESKEITKILLDVGGYFAYGGASTFKNYKKHDVIKYIPLDRIMCETDCPYMPPEPHRGKVNEPCNVKYVYEQIAKVKEVELEKLASCVEENFKRLFTKYN